MRIAFQIIFLLLVAVAALYLGRVHIVDGTVQFERPITAITFLVYVMCTMMGI